MDERHARNAAVSAPEILPGGRQRIRLRDFQTQLIDRMRKARSDAAPVTRQLGIMTGTTRWLLNLQQAGEIITPTAIVSAPMTQDWFLGLMNVRGNLVSVIDLARFQGLAPTTIDKACRVIAIAPGLAKHGGLLVSRVLGLRSSADMRAEAEDAGHGEGSDAGQEGRPVWSGKAYLDAESQRWTELDLSQVVRDPRFLNVAR